jgi:hypothetical protein
LECQVDKAEKLNIRKLGIGAFTMHDVDRHGIGMVSRDCPTSPVDANWARYPCAFKVMEMALKMIDPHASKQIHLSFDMDVVDMPTSQVVHAASLPPNRFERLSACVQMWGPIARIKGGLSYREVHYLAEAMAATGRLASVEVCAHARASQRACVDSPAELASPRAAEPCASCGCAVCTRTRVRSQVTTDTHARKHACRLWR